MINGASSIITVVRHTKLSHHVFFYRAPEIINSREHGSSWNLIEWDMQSSLKRQFTPKSICIFPLEERTVLHNCITAIKDWMADNFLRLNADKSEVLIVASDSIASSVAQGIGNLLMP